jgi:hypothetical protein
MVEIQWMDPCWQRVSLVESPKGRAALATWVERGVIYDVTDGVVIIQHSLAAHIGKPISEPDEHAFTPIPESLIERIVVYAELPTEGS